MNQRIKQQWIEALRSGKYKQTREVLRDNSGFCCLGVLTDIYLKEHNLSWTVESGCFLAPERQDVSLPQSVVDWAGLSCKYGSPTDRDGIEFATHNDDGWSFKEIAKMIESDL